MCVSCGCGSPNDNHGDPRNLTKDQIHQAAQAAGKSDREVAENISRSMGGGSR